MWTEYQSPTTVAEALALLRAKDGAARVIAGGTDLALQAQRGESGVACAVDVTGIPELNVIALEGPDLVIGACVTHAQAASDPLVRRHAPALATACSAVGSPQIRNAGTIGGNIVNAQPAADAVIALLALDATVVIARQDGTRREPLFNLFAGPGRSGVDATHEIVVQVRLPIPADGERSAFVRLARRGALALPMLNVAVAAKISPDTIDWARIAIGPVAPVPYRAVRAEAALRGGPRSLEAVLHASQIAADEAQPRSSLLRGNREYRKRMVAVLVRRALLQALALE